MPSTMIHLNVAYTLFPQGKDIFFVGAVAPDAIKERNDKDITHFRVGCDRALSIKNLALKLKPNFGFSEGYLLHLFTDWKWDTTLMHRYMCKIGENWFEKYHWEISRASSYIYHNSNWGVELINRLSRFDFSQCESIQNEKNEDICDLLMRNVNWHHKNNTGSSLEFTVDQVEDFVNKTADDYIKWKKTIFL